MRRLPVEIRTRQQAILLGIPTYFTGPCKNGHIAEKFVSNYMCVECQRLGAQRYRAANTEKVAERHKKYYEANKDRYGEYDRRQKETKREILNEKQKERYRLDIERSRAMRRAARARRVEEVRANQRKRYQENLESERSRARDRQKRLSVAIVARNAARRASRLRATPSWADKTLILEFYERARRLTLETGVRHEVDHIVPLISDLVCGLHTQANLRVITAAENSSKKNRLVEEIL